MASALVTCTKAVWVTAGWSLPSPAWPQSHHYGRRCCTYALSFFSPSCHPSFPLFISFSPLTRWSLITLIRSGIRSILTCMQESFISGSGGWAIGWMLLWTTVCLSVGMERCSSAAQQHRGSSGAPCWKRPTPSKVSRNPECPRSRYISANSNSKQQTGQVWYHLPFQ